MYSARVVEIHEPFDSIPKFRHVFVFMKVEFFILHRPPKAFNKYVLQTPANSRHADIYPMAFQEVGELIAGTLTSVIAMEYCRLAICIQSLLQAFDAK